jgi:hypothetical protein
MQKCVLVFLKPRNVVKPPRSFRKALNLLNQDYGKTVKTLMRFVKGVKYEINEGEI